MSNNLMENYQLIYKAVIEMLILWISVLVAISTIECDAKRNLGKARASIEMFGYEHVCSAQIISENVVITSAECITSSTPSEYQIHVGIKHGKRHLHNVTEVIVHPNFNPETKEHNIAMLVLGQDINFKAAEASRMLVCDAMPAPGTMVRITGWPETIDSNIPDEQKTKQELDDEAKKSLADLQNVNVQLISNEECENRFDDEVHLTNVFCAESPGKGNACHGDGGGPLFFKQKYKNTRVECLVGITSMEYGCPVSATPDNPNPTTFPGIYTNVLKYEEWIAETVLRNYGSVAIPRIRKNPNSRPVRNRT